jgi:hypothetical protein
LPCARTRAKSDERWSLLERGKAKDRSPTPMSEGSRSDRGQTRAPDSTAVIDNAAATLGGHTGAETVLTHTANFRRLILAFHKVAIAPGGCEVRQSTKRSRTVKPTSRFIGSVKYPPCPSILQASSLASRTQVRPERSWPSPPRR